MVTYHSATVKIKIERILAEGKVDKEYLGDLSGGGVDQEFYTKNFPITHDAGEAGGSGAADGVGTDTIFQTDLTEANDYWNGMTIRFTAGANNGEKRVINDYAQANGQITASAAFTAAPGAADTFVIEPSVDVFTDDNTRGSWTEYLEDGTDYTIDGTTGLVTILAAENAGGNANEHICISYYTSRTIARAQNVAIEVDGSLQDIHELGNRAPQEIKEGNIFISGTIGQLYNNRNLFGKVLGVKDFYNRLADFSFYVYPNKEVTGQPQVKLENVKFGGPARIGVTLNTILAIDVTFKGLVISEGLVP